MNDFDKQVICKWIRADNSDDAKLLALPDDLLLTLHPEYAEVGPHPKRFSEISDHLIEAATNPEVVDQFTTFLKSVPTIMTNEYVVTAALKPVTGLAKAYASRGNGIDWLASLLNNISEAEYENSYDEWLDAGAYGRYADYARVIYCCLVDEEMGKLVFTTRELVDIKAAYEDFALVLTSSKEVSSV